MENEIGRSSPSASAPNTTEHFRFNLNPGTSRVAPFDIVVAHSEDQGDTFGIVTELFHTGGDASLAEVKVLWNSAGSFLPVAGDTAVFFPDPEGIHQALGVADIPEERRIQAGLIEQSDGTRAVAFLDRDLIVGPAAGHVNISGSEPCVPYFRWLQQSLRRILAAAHRFAGVDVKNRELIKSFEPVVFKHDEQERWKPLLISTDSRVERKVATFYPKGEVTTDDKIYAYDLEYTASKLDLIFANIPDPTRALALLREEIVRGLGRSGDNAWIQVQRWSDLWNKPPLVQQGIPQSFRGVTAREVAQFLSLLRHRVESQFSGIYVDQQKQDLQSISDAIKSITPFTELAIIDVATLPFEEQYLVIGDVLRESYELCSREDLTPEPRKFTLFLDDLDRFAGSWVEPTDPVLRELFEIVERGPGMGMTLIGAQQSISDLHPRLAAKFTTRLFGRGAGGAVDPAIGELLAPGLRGQLSRLEPDQLILTHPVYRHPVKIRYPRFT